MDAVLYHGKCPDGFCSAFIAKKRYPEAELIPMDHGSPVPFDQVAGRDVLVLDFSWPNREDNIRLHDSAKSFHIYDHHLSAQQRLEGLDFVTFDMKRSGAGLTWDYLFGKDSLHPSSSAMPKKRPFYIDFVEDRDLWNWALPGSKAINAYIMSLPMTIEAWHELELMKVEYAEQAGIGILRHIDRYVKEAVQESQRGFIAVGPNKYLTCEVVNAPYMSCSEIGNALANKADVGLTWFERSDGMLQFSLRSVGDIDVSEIAKTYLGGGHCNASGFRLSLQDGRELIDQILGR